MGKHARLPALGRAPEAADADVQHLPRLQTRYFAFLSYSHKDKELADWLHRELERFRVPRALRGRLTANGVVPKRLTPIFRDEHDLAAAGDLGGEIKATLAVSQFLIVLCSPTAAVSRWTNAEVEWFKHSHPNGTVLAAIAAGEPFASEVPGREDEECFPPALRQKYDRRGRPTGKRADPLAADLRGHDEARRTGFLKLVAGMLGVGLDELVQRETTRKHRRMAWLTAASLAGMAMTSTLSVIAIQSRDAARDQRREAEGLVAFMVGDLKDKLEPIGRLDALDGVGTRVLAYYSKQDTSELTDAALLQRARALSITAQVAYARGNLDQAQALYRQAMTGTEEAVRRSPDDPKRLFEHAQNVFWLGEIARWRGQTDQAVAAYSEYKRLADRLVALEPDNLKWRMEGLYGVENVGISLYNERRYAEALSQFQSALGAMQNLVTIDPANLTYRKELPKVLAWQAQAERALGRLDEAVAARTRQVALLNGSVVGGVTDVDFRAQLVIARQALGILLTWRAQMDRGVAELRAAVDEADRLLLVEPQNALWRNYTAGTRLELAKALLSAGNRADAAQQTSRACAILDGIRATPVLVASRVDCLLMRSRLALQSGAGSDALGAAQQALAAARQLHSEDPLKDKYRIASVYRLIGDARQKMGDAAAANAGWADALSSLPQGSPESPAEMDERATILERLGRAAEARQLAARLDALGYRRLG
jgi:tetratricopeptide (TPR) repeat protein